MVQDHASERRTWIRQNSRLGETLRTARLGRGGYSHCMKVHSRRARIALIAGFGAVVIAARLAAFHSGHPGVAGTVASIAAVVMLVAGVVSLYIGTSSLDWKKLRNKLRKRRRR